MSKRKVVWKGKKEEGMTYKEKVELMDRLELLLVVNSLSMREPTCEEERLSYEAKLSAERAERIKKYRGESLKGSIEVLKRLPKEILDKIKYIEAFALSYFDKELRKEIQAYYDENNLK